jgi:hypothetical protein
MTDLWIVNGMEEVVIYFNALFYHLRETEENYKIPQ